MIGALALVGFVAAPALADEPASITLRVDRTKLTVADDLTLTVSLSGEVDGLQPPDLGNFTVVGQRTEQRIDMQRGRTFAQVYSLRPKKTGTFQIGPAQATLRGQVVATAAAVTITVEEPKAQAPVTADEALNVEATDEAAFLRWSVPRTSFYLGEPFPLTLNLWLRTELNASSPELVTQPKLDGLLVEDLKVDPARGAERKTLGSNTYDVYPLSAQIATPLRAGKVLVDQTTLRLAVSQGGGFLAQQRRTTLNSPPFYLDIKEVPTEGRPMGFSPRNIGQFTMTAKLVDERGTEPTRARTGQRLILRAEVRGTGNLVSLEAPQVIAADASAFEISPLSGTADDHVDKTPQGMSGVRVFQWLVSANQPGNVTTPKLRLAIFDPVAAKFSVIEIDGRPLEVSGAAVTAVTDQASALGEDVGPIVEKDALAPASGVGLPRSGVYWAAMALPLIGFGFVEARFRRTQLDRKNPGARASRGAGQNAKKRLRAAEQALKDGLVKDFYGQLARTLASYFEERANIPATGMTHQEVRGAARTAGYPADLADAWVVEMENCDFARFAPTGSAADKMREAIGRVSDLIDRLEKIAPERRP